MANEPIDIVVTDKIAKSIPKTLQEIATESRKSFDAVNRLQAALNGLKPAGLAALQAANSRNQAAMAASAIAAQRLATAQQQTASAASQAAAAQSKAAAAATQATVAQQALAAATARTATAQAQSQAATQKIATAQQQTAAATSRATAAQNQAAISAIRLQQAQSKLNTSIKTTAQSFLMYARNIAGIVGIGFGVREIIQLGDAYTTLNNKLSTVSKTQAQSLALSKALFEIANKTSTPIEDTVTAFTRFDRALAGLGRSQKESLRLTQTINESLQLSGANTGEAAAGLLQLSQAFNKGKLDGDEFRTVMELMPDVADAIARELKVTRGELLLLAPQGKITGKVLADALAGAADEIDKRFAGFVPTVAQSLVRLKNSAIESFGEFNKAVGITSGLSKLIIGLSNNMDTLGTVIKVIGAGLIVYFGPNLIAMLVTATRAAWAFSVAISSNPIGLLVAGISLAVIAIDAFSKKNEQAANGVATIKDKFLGAFEIIGDYAKATGSYIADVFAQGIDWIKNNAGGLVDFFAKIGSDIIEAFKIIINGVIAFWVGGFNSIRIIWNKFPETMEFVFKSAVNFAIAAVEQVVNVWQVGLRGVADILNSFAPTAAKSLNAALDSIKIVLPRLQVSDSAKAAAKDIKDAFVDAATTDYLGNAGKAISERAQQTADARQTKAFFDQMEREKALRAASTPTGAEGADKVALKRAEALRRVNAELNAESDRLFQLEPVRAVQAQMDQIELDFAKKKISLSQGEKAALREKITVLQENNRIQKDFDNIIKAATEPYEEYNRVFEAGIEAAKYGSDAYEAASRAINIAREAYENAVDPLRQFDAELTKQNYLLQFTGKELAAQQALQQLENELLQKGIYIRDQVTGVLTAEGQKRLENLRATQDNIIKQQAENQVYAETIGKLAEYEAKLNAIVALKNAGDKAQQTVSANPDFDFANTQTMFDAQSKQYEDMYLRIDQLRQKDLINEQTAGALRAQVFAQQQSAQLQSANTFFGNLAQLQNSKSKEMQRIGKAAAIAQTVIKTYESATSAYASLAGIPYVGPALGIAAAAAAVAAGMANVAAIKAQPAGFMAGGWTGSGPADEVAGAVHGQEWVANAKTTRRIGVGNLQALQSGAASVTRNSSNAGNGGSRPINVDIKNYGTSKSFEVQQISPEEIRIIARDEATNQIAKRVPDLVSNEIANPNSRVSKSMAKNTQTARRR